MLMQPSPIADTSRPLLPSLRFSMVRAPIVVEGEGNSRPVRRILVELRTAYDLRGRSRQYPPTRGPGCDWVIDSVAAAGPLSSSVSRVSIWALNRRVDAVMRDQSATRCYEASHHSSTRVAECVSHFEGSPASTSIWNHTRPGCRLSWSQVPS